MPDSTCLHRRDFIAGLMSLAGGCAAPPARTPGTSAASSSAPPAPTTAKRCTAPAPVAARLSAIERSIGGRLGVFALDARSGCSLGQREDERFAMCSTFKWALAAAILERVDRGELALKTPVPYAEADVLEYAPVTRKHVRDGALSIRELARAAVVVSDNTAANLLMQRIGGPAGVTAFFRRLGDMTTRLDRNEPLLNANAPGDARDTTTPRAMAAALEALFTGSVLSQASLELLTSWMVACETCAERLRRGFPAGWKTADKTGSGSNGGINDVAVTWRDAQAPLFVACYLSGSTKNLPALNAAHQRVGEVVAAWASGEHR